VERKEVSFISGGEQIAAWEYASAGTEGTVPAVVLAHGLGGVREAGLPPFAERFAAAGFRVLVFDYRHYGASTGEPRQLIDVGRQLDDWRAAIAYARRLEGVDPERVAIWGWSLGGGHVLTIAAEDRRLGAAVAQTPMADGLAALGVFTPARVLRAVGNGLRDELARIRGRSPVYVPLAGPPGSSAAIVTDDPVAGYERMLPARSTFQNRMPARLLLRFPMYRPNRHASRISCPLLVCACDSDNVTPPQAAVKAAERAPRGELIHYAGRHFDTFAGDLNERAVADHTAFLTRTLLA
jgi:alpha-beta hydrolase superfamily lysophospholipase